MLLKKDKKILKKLQKNTCFFVTFIVYLSGTRGNRGQNAPKLKRLQTARYALKREVATERSVFPWSMSDFKPGEVRKLQKSTMKHAVPLFVAEQRGVAAEGALSTYSRTIDLRRKPV